MRRIPVWIILLLSPMWLYAADSRLSESEVSSPEIVSRSEWAQVDLDSPVPIDILTPEGRTRWDLRGLRLGLQSTRTITSLDGGEFLVEEISRDKTGGSFVTWTLPGEFRQPELVEGWILPHHDRDLLQANADHVFQITQRLEVSGREVRRGLRVRTRRVGAGWLILPSGPRAVVLQRAVITEEIPGVDSGVRSVVHRWIDPQFGVVAEIQGPSQPGDHARIRVAQASVIQQALLGATGLKVYADEIDAPILTRLAYGFDRGAATPVASMTPDGHVTIADLVAAGSWDFRPTTSANSIAEIATTSTQVGADETCNNFRCGFDIPEVKLGREDKNFDDPANAKITLSVIEREQRANDVTLWLRGGVRNEGVSDGGLGESESRFCYTSGVSQEVPLWRFGHEDAGGFYMELGDSWSSAPFECEQNLFNHVCPSVACGFGCALFTYACDDRSGTLSNVVVAEGPVTLPSGHIFNALVVRNVVDFCLTVFSGCAFSVDTVNTGLYLWVVPNIGTVARLMSGQSVIDVDTFTDLAETDIKFGLFPPVSISAGQATGSSVSLSWDPGLDTRRIDGYKVYWDTDSGVDSPYVFDSELNPEQIVVDGTTATISGLEPGTSYFVTVVALSDYTDVATGIMRTYESALFPLRLAAATPVPAEVEIMTDGGTCTPTEEVNGLTLRRVGSSVEACWLAVDDPCVEGYTLLGSPTVDTADDFHEVVSDTGAVTCHTFDSPEAFFLVVSNGSGGTGPWGHYRR